MDNMVSSDMIMRTQLQVAWSLIGVNVNANEMINEYLVLSSPVRETAFVALPSLF